MKRKAATLLVIFTMILVCFALLSWAVSSAGVAHIKVVSASSQTITHKLSVEGTLSHRSEEAALVEPNQGEGTVYVEASIPANDAQDIIGKDVVATIVLPDEVKVNEVPLLTKLSEDGSQLSIQVVMPEGDWPYANGSSVQIEIVTASADYRKCLPAESIYIEGSRAFVYVVCEVPSLTGTELGVQKVYVTVLDSSQFVVAVDDSSVTREQMVVVQSDRVINEDTRVRITE